MPRNNGKKYLIFDFKGIATIANSRDEADRWIKDKEEWYAEHSSHPYAYYVVAADEYEV